MKVGVLGSGTVGQTLAAGFLKHGHEAMIGTREPAKLADWNKANPKGRIGSSSEAAKFGEVIVLAVKGGAAVDALRGADKANLAGKPVMDACNPIADAPPVSWRAAILHRSERVANGAAAEGVLRSSLRQSLQLRRSPANDRSPVRRRHSPHYVHLRQQRRGEERRSPGSSTSLVGRPRTWAR